MTKKISFWIIVYIAIMMGVKFAFLAQNLSDSLSATSVWIPRIIGILTECLYGASFGFVAQKSYDKWVK